MLKVAPSELRIRLEPDPKINMPRGKTMKRLLVSAMLLLPLPALADHMDVLEFKLLEGCSFSQFMEIVGDFNDWGKDYGYNTEIAVPLQSDNLINMFWVGTSSDAATFGKAWDAWRDARDDSDSTPAKLDARFNECAEFLNRRGYDIY